MNPRKLIVYVISILCAYICQANEVDSLTNIINTTKNDSLKVKLYRDLGVRFLDSDSCMYFFSKGIDIATESDLQFDLANIYFVIGVKKHRSNDLDSAIEYYLKSEVHYKKSYEQRDTVEVESRLANTYYSFALTYLFKGEYQQVMQYGRKSLDISLKNKDDGKILDCINLLGHVHRVQDEFEKAESYFLDGLRTATDLSDTSKMSIFYNNLAAVYTNTKEYEKALEYFRICLELKKGAPNEELIDVKMNIGTTLRFLKRYDEARVYLIEGVEAFDQSNDLRGKIISLNLLTELYIDTKEWNKAITLSKRSLKLIEVLPLTDQKKFIHLNLSAAYEGLGNTKMALENYKEYTLLKDSLFNEEKSAQINKLEAQFEFEKKEKEISQLTEANLLNEIQIAEDRNIKLGLIAIFLFVIMIATIYFVNYQRKQERDKQNIALKKMEIEQRMLRSQMNPHFIFNALNSIQSYVTTNKTYEAEVFLSKFSTLIRNILELSLNELISFDLELETLTLYLELEKLRFDDKFDFEINNQLSDPSYKIPPMLIQPFVENAIIHGMKGKTNKGSIKISLTEHSDDLILCSIDDDGVGRKPIETQKDHISLATQLTDERIQFFNKKNNHQFDIKIIDKKDDEMNAMGTRVELLIPII